MLLHVRKPILRLRRIQRRRREDDRFHKIGPLRGKLYRDKTAAFRAYHVRRAASAPDESARITLDFLRRYAEGKTKARA